MAEEQGKNSDKEDEAMSGLDDGEDQSDKVPSYEELRERNIRDRQELFNRMGFDSIKQGFSTEDKKKQPSQRGLVVNKVPTAAAADHASDELAATMQPPAQPVA